jgi:uncharacterized protein YqgC (DUF456 family)
MPYVYATLLTLLNLLFWVGILFNLPGTWLMLLTAVLADWLQPDVTMFGTPVLVTSGLIALAGEAAELAFGAAGARRSGGSRRGAALAIAGGVVGAIMGLAIPVPVLGSLVGASAGAFVGAVAGDLWAGRHIHHSVASGRGAAYGRFWGTAAKSLLGAAMFLLLTIAAFI